jgi:lipoic acid synthetase
MFRKDYLKKPPWLKVKIPAGNKFSEVYKLLQKYNLATVCQEARCPNIHECWGKKSATIMVLGRICTRACRFCAVETGNPDGKVDIDEPKHVAEVINKLGLEYVVITSVDRDDLDDMGSGHYARVIEYIKSINPSCRVETLIPDFNGQERFLEKVIKAKPFVIGHNVETVARLTSYIRDRRCTYDKSLHVLKQIKKMDPGIYTKSGFMVGLGEEKEDILQTIQDLKDCQVDVITIGQYLQPTRKHHPVQKYYTPDEFLAFKKISENMGIRHILSGPLVRSSYHASEVFKNNQ